MKSVFEGVDTKTCELIIPKGSEEAYKAADGWREFFEEAGINSIKDDITLISYCILNGVQVNGELAPGIYIKRQGGKSVKVIEE